MRHCHIPTDALSCNETEKTEPDRAKKKTLIAKDMISGIKVKVAEMETAGEWQWKLEESEKKQLAVKIGRAHV